MIKIIDYGLGNILAFQNVYKRLNVETATARTAADIRDASKLVLPGVGAFDHAMALLENSGMRGALEDAVLRSRVPVLGICVGMQILARSSDEGESPGLGWVDAHIRAFKAVQTEPLALPHMGWNDVRPTSRNGLFRGLEADARFYFLHSYFAECRQQENVAAVSTYGTEFCCALHADNVYGVQFHPEKSHRFGTQLLKNFAEL